MIERTDQSITLDDFAAAVHKINDECGTVLPPCMVSYATLRRIEFGKIPCPECGLAYEYHI